MAPSRWSRALHSLSLGTSSSSHEGSSRRPPTTNTQSPPSAIGCRLLQLPRELRNEIYTYIPTLPSITIYSITLNPIHSRPNDTLHKPLWPVSNEDDDPVPFQPPGNSGLLLFYGIPPPMNALLVCKQMHDEVLDHFFSSTTFEVGPLTPHHDEWRIDPTYQKLRSSTRLSQVRKLEVRVDLERMQMVSSRSQDSKYAEITLETCVLAVQQRAEMLVRVLRNGASSLQRITVIWKDEFPEDGDWGLKSSVLFPFGQLAGVNLVLGRVVIAEQVRDKHVQRLREALEGLSV